MKTRILYNRFLPFKGYVAMAAPGFILARKEFKPLNLYTLNHERIHLYQQRELLYVGFYLAYVGEWLWRVVSAKKDAYRGLSFEREAYDNMYRLGYLADRKPFAQWRKRL